jgi:WD40 repeat protein
LATGALDGTACVWSLETSLGADTSRLTRVAHDGRVLSGINALALSPDARFLATASFDGTARIWWLDADVELYRTEHRQSATGVAYNADGSLLVTAGADGLIKVHTTEALAAYDDADLAEYARLPANIRDIVDGNVVKETRSIPDGAGINAIAMTRDGGCLATGGEGGKARLWTTYADSPYRVIDAGGPVRALAFSGNGRRLALVTSAGEGQVWSLEPAT